MQYMPNIVAVNDHISKVGFHAGAELHLVFTQCFRLRLSGGSLRGCHLGLY